MTTFVARVVLGCNYRFDSDGGISTRLSVDSYNYETSKAYMQVLDLDEQSFYPRCTGLNYPKKIGDGFCDEYPPYNTKECGWDGDDCDPKPVDSYPDCMVHYPGFINDSFCDDYPPYNTEACGWDGGDCIDSVLKPVDGYPGCMVPNKRQYGNGFCNDFPPYNTEACGWDGGDCEPLY